ncbi:MAG: universal stress protein [Acidobacteriota bacterium]|nr:universal stress protein [Acidobacteriota bacterium]
MINIKRVLCPIDLSTDSDQALRYALALTRAYEAELAICYRPEGGELAKAGLVHDGPIADSPVPERGQEVFKRAVVKFLAPEEKTKLNWHGLLIHGEEVGEAITKAASECRADLIVMRSRRRPHRAALLGSTAESVCRSAPCPVLVTHTDERDWVQPLSKSISLQRVLVPYDFSDYSELALNYALSFAQEYQAELHLLHVLPPHTVNEPEIAWYPNQRESAYHNAARRLQRAVPPEAHLWCQIKHAVSEGQPYREVLNYAEKNAIDLISIGAHGAGFGMRALFGSNVDRVLRQAPCPVLVARPWKPAIVGESARELSKTVVQAEATV